MREWSEERKAEKRNSDTAWAQRAILAHLAPGGAYAEHDIGKALLNKTGRGYIWVALRQMERSHLVCRASDYERPVTYHQWRITGCGLLAAASRA